MQSLETPLRNTILACGGAELFVRWKYPQICSAGHDSTNAWLLYQGTLTIPIKSKDSYKGFNFFPCDRDLSLFVFTYSYLFVSYTIVADIVCK